MLNCFLSSKSFRNEPSLIYRLVNKKLMDGTEFAHSLQLMNTGKLSNQGNCGNKVIFMY